MFVLYDDFTYFDYLLITQEFADNIIRTFAVTFKEGRQYSSNN